MVHKDISTAILRRNAPERCNRAGIPTEVVFQTQPPGAEGMRRRAFAPGIQARWGVGDAVSGDNCRWQGVLEEREQGSVLAVSGKESVWHGVSQSASRDLMTQHLSPPPPWQHLSAGEGNQGPHRYDGSDLSTHRPLPPG